VDQDGKLYAIGQFMRTLAFATGEGTVNLRSSGGEDLFLIRLI
jgi:hypothetical protein